MRAALAARGYAPRHALQAAAHRPRRHRAVPAHLRARRARAPGDARARLESGRCHALDVLAFRRADALFLAAAGGSCRCVAVRADRGVSCAVHASGLRYALPERRRRPRRRRPARRARRARRHPRAQRRRQDDADAAPQRAADGQGELEVAGLNVARDDVRDLRARVGLVFQDPDDQLFMPTVREDVAFGPLNLGCSRIEAEDRIAEALARGPDGASSATAPRTSSRSASAAASRSPRCWRCARACSCSTSPRPTSTRARGAS